MATQDQINMAIEAYRRGQLDEAGGHIALPRNAGEADDDYNARMRGALALPDWVPTPLPLPGMTGTLEAEKAPDPEPEQEDNPEPEDEEDDPHPHGGKRRQRRA